MNKPLKLVGDSLTRNSEKRKRLEEREQTENAVEELRNKLKDDDQFFKGVLSGVRILVLSCDRPLRLALKERLAKEGYTALVIDEMKKMFPNIPEFEVENKAIGWAEIIIAIEDRDVNKLRRCPGFVQECTIIMGEPNYQPKTIYICPTTVPKEELISVTDKHYLYFPRIHQMDYKKKKTEKVEELFLITKKEAHRIARGIVRKATSGKGKENLIKGNTNICSRNNRIKD